MPVKVAVIGCGYWGKFLIRNLYDLNVLGWVCDTRPEVLAELERSYVGLKGVSSLERLWKQEGLTAVFIATPSQSHFAIATEAIRQGKHVYVEKPMASSTQEAEALKLLAEKENKHLMVGHLLLYHPAVNRLKKLISDGELGDLRYIQSDRLNWNWGRADHNVMWDLSPHDLSLLLYLSDCDFSVSSVLAQRTQADGKIDVLSAALQGKNGLQAQIQASWVFPKKQVQCLVVGSKGNAVLDFTAPELMSLKLLRPNKQGHWQEIVMPYLPLEPLKLECLHFLNTLQTQSPCFSNGENGLAVVRLLDDIQALAERKGL